MSDDLPFYVMFEAASAQAAAFELRARLVADLSEKGGTISVDGTLEKVLQYLKMQHPEGLSSEEWETLDLGRKVRNKLFHGELHAASALVNAPAGGVLMGTLTPGASGSEILSQIEKLAGGAGQPVHGTTTKDIGVFGWLFEAYSSGALERMILLFVAAKKCTSKLADFLNAKPDNQTSPK